MSAVLEQVKKREIILNPVRMHLAGYARHEYVVNAEEGTTIEDVLNPAYWAHVAQDKQMQPFDRVEVRLETGEWTADFIVTNAGRNWATVKMIGKYDLAPQSTEADTTVFEAYEVLYKGPQMLHCVVRKSDRAVIQSGMRTKAEATAWLANHEAATRPG